MGSLGIRRSPLTLLAASVAAGLLAASAAAAHPLTAAAYRAHARSICTVAKRADDALPEPKHGDTAQAIADWKAEIGIETTEVAALKRLTPPKSLAPLVRVGLADKDAGLA